MLRLLALSAAAALCGQGLELLGEEAHEIEQTLRDIAADKTDILTIGQYLQPSDKHLPVARWAPPEEFVHWKNFGLGLGIGVALVYTPAIGCVQPWFTRRRGFAVAIASSGASFGNFLMPSLVAAAVARQSEVRRKWRGFTVQARSWFMLPLA